MSRHPVRRRLRAAIPFTLILVGLAVPAAVVAHAELETVSPADGTTVTVAPTEIVMTFSEALDPAKSSIVLAESGGSPLLSGGVVDPADATRMTLATPDLAPGEYEIRWTSASTEDGDIDRGTTHFTYAPPPSPSATASTAPSVAPSPSLAGSPSVAPSPSPSTAGTPAASSTDVLLPIVAALAVVVLLGVWLLRNRARGAGR